MIAIAVTSALIFWNVSRNIKSKERENQRVTQLQIEKEDALLAKQSAVDERVSQIRIRTELLDELAYLLITSSNYSDGKNALDEGINKLLGNAALLEEPTLEGYVLGVQAKIYQDLFEFDNAVTSFRKAVSLLSSELSNDDPLVLENRIGLVTSLTKLAVGYNSDTEQFSKFLGPKHYIARLKKHTK